MPVTTQQQKGGGGGGALVAPPAASEKMRFSMPLKSDLERNRQGNHLGLSVRGEIKDIRKAFLDELKDAKRGAKYSYMLETSLTYQLGIMPEDIADAAEAVANLDKIRASYIVDPDTVYEDEEIAQDHVDISSLAIIPLSAYILLFTAVMGLASAGPLLNMQPDVNALLKVYWRMTATWMLMLPFCIYSIRKHGWPELNVVQWCTFLLTTVFFAHCCACFSLALDYTTVGNVVILTNTQSLILLAGKFFSPGDQVLPMEALGAIVAFTGTVLCSKDAALSASDDAGMASESWKGIAYGLATAFLGVGYLVLAKAIRPHICLYVFMFLVTFVGTMNVLMVMVVMNADISYGRDPGSGLFGWMNLDSDRLPVEIAMVFLCNILGLLGYVRAMQYFDALVISVAALMEPVAAELMAFVLGVGVLPGVWGWVGNALVFAGTLAVVIPTAIKK